MSSLAQQKVWSIDHPFERRDFSFYEQSERSRELTKSTLGNLLQNGVQWAQSLGCINVRTPTLGEIVVTLFNSFGTEPDETMSLRVLASVMASNSINGKACIGDALRSILRQQSPQALRLRREASLSAERDAHATFEVLFASPVPVRQPQFSSISQSVVDRTVPWLDRPLGFVTSTPASEDINARMARLELDRDTLMRRLTAAAPPAVPSPSLAPPQAKVDKKVKAVSVAQTPVPVPVVSPPSVSPSAYEDTNGDDTDSSFDGLPMEAMGLAGLAGAEASVAETIPDDERGTLNKEALSPDLYLNLLDPKRWPAMCRAHLRTDVIKKFEAYYEDFTHRRRHDAVAYISILRSAAAICEEDLTPPGMKKVRMHVIAQVQLVIGRFEFWRDEARQGTAAAAAGEAAQQRVRVALRKFVTDSPYLFCLDPYDKPRCNPGPLLGNAPSRPSRKSGHLRRGNKKRSRRLVTFEQGAEFAMAVAVGLDQYHRGNWLEIAVREAMSFLKHVCRN